MNTKEDHQDKVDVQLRKRDISIDELKGNLDKKEDAAKIKYYERMYLI